MTARDGRRRQPPPKVALAMEAARRMIAEGGLLPGGLAPTAAALREATGISDAYCRDALVRLVRDGTLEIIGGRRRRAAGTAGGNG